VGFLYTVSDSWGSHMAEIRLEPLFRQYARKVIFQFVHLLIILILKKLSIFLIP